MSTCHRSRPTFLLLVLLLLAGVPYWGCSQSPLTVLHHFTGGVNDGDLSANGPVLDGGVLYGTTRNGGTSNLGTIFALRTDGSGYTNLHSFTGSADGSLPVSSLTLADGVLYGASLQGGSLGYGTLYAIGTNGAGFSVLHHFLGSNDGRNPYPAPARSGGMLYGTTYAAGSSNNGVVYAINTNGGSYNILNNITNSVASTGPYAGVAVSAGRLYGAVPGGGAFTRGYLFSSSTNGTGYTNLHNFTASEVGGPYGTPLIAGGRLYVALFSGSSIVAMNTDGAGYTTLRFLTNSTDGSGPFCSLTLVGDTLFGVANGGGPTGNGTLFCLRTNGTGFVVLHSFTGGLDGGHPYGGVVVSGNLIYGTTSTGGSAGKGTVYAFNVVQALGTDQLGITQAGNQIVLYWPAWATNVGLQATSDLTNGVWVDFTNGTPIIGLVTTNSGSNTFFRLQPH